MATTAFFSSAAHHFPSTTFVPGGALSIHVRLIDRSILFGKFFSFACSAGTPSISTTRDETTGSSSASAVTLGCVFSSVRIPPTSLFVISIKKTFGRFGADEICSSDTTAFCTR